MTPEASKLRTENNLSNLAETEQNAVRAITCSSIEETKYYTRQMTGPDARSQRILETALDYEKSHGNRSTALKLIRSALAKVTVNPLDQVPHKDPPKPTLRRNKETGLVEVIDPWDRPRRILDGIKLCVRMSIAGQVLLGHELSVLKKDMGFLGNARKTAPGGQFVHGVETWPQLIEKNLQISYKTADRMIACFEAAKARLKKLGHLKNLPSGSKKLELLFTSRPDSMTDDDRDALAKCVDKLVDGDSQTDLLKELKIIKFHVPLTGGDTSKHKKPSDEQMMQQLAFNFFSPIAAGLHRLRVDNDREAFLHALDIHSSDEDAITLTTLERDLEAALNDVRTAKKARMKVATGKVIESKA